MSLSKEADTVCDVESPVGNKKKRAASAAFDERTNLDLTQCNGAFQAPNEASGSKEATGIVVDSPSSKKLCSSGGCVNDSNKKDWNGGKNDAMDVNDDKPAADFGSSLSNKTSKTSSTSKTINTQVDGVSSISSTTGAALDPLTTASATKILPLGENVRFSKEESSFITLVVSAAHSQSKIVNGGADNTISHFLAKKLYYHGIDNILDRLESLGERFGTYQTPYLLFNVDQLNVADRFEIQTQLQSVYLAQLAKQQKRPPSEAQVQAKLAKAKAKEEANVGAIKAVNPSSTTVKDDWITRILPLEKGEKFLAEEAAFIAHVASKAFDQLNGVAGSTIHDYVVGKLFYHDPDKILRQHKSRGKAFPYLLFDVNQLNDADRAVLNTKLQSAYLARLAKQQKRPQQKRPPSEAQVEAKLAKAKAKEQAAKEKEEAGFWYALRNEELKMEREQWKAQQKSLPESRGDQLRRLHEELEVKMDPKLVQLFNRTIEGVGKEAVEELLAFTEEIRLFVLAALNKAGSISVSEADFPFEADVIATHRTQAPSPKSLEQAAALFKWCIEKQKRHKHIVKALETPVTSNLKACPSDDELNDASEYCMITLMDCLKAQWMIDSITMGAHQPAYIEEECIFGFIEPLPKEADRDVCKGGVRQGLDKQEVLYVDCESRDYSFEALTSTLLSSSKTNPSGTNVVGSWKNEDNDLLLVFIFPIQNGISKTTLTAHRTAEIFPAARGYRPDLILDLRSSWYIDVEGQARPTVKDDETLCSDSDHLFHRSKNGFFEVMTMPHSLNSCLAYVRKRRAGKDYVPSIKHRRDDVL